MSSTVIANPLKQHHHRIQLPHSFLLVVNYAKKVTTVNLDGTRLSDDAFSLVTSLLNIAKD